MAHFLAPALRQEPDDDDDDDDDADDDDDDLDEEEVIPMHDAAVLQFLRERCGGHSSFYLAPSIPERKERTVRSLHAAHLPPHEPILALYDGTVFGSADDGFVLNAWRLCWKNFTEQPQMLIWHQIDPDRIHVDGNKIHIRSAVIDTYLPDDSDFMDVLEEVFPILARSARKAAAATPRAAPVAVAAPPPAPGGYGAPPSMHGGHAPPQPLLGCWHCRVPLHWQAPRCGRCGAMPGPQGWPRLA